MLALVPRSVLRLPCSGSQGVCGWALTPAPRLAGTSGACLGKAASCKGSLHAQPCSGTGDVGKVSSNCWCRFYVLWKHGRAGFYPEVSETLHSVIPWERRVLRKLLSGAGRCLPPCPCASPSRPSTITCGAFSVSKMPRPLGPRFCSVVAGDSSVFTTKLNSSKLHFVGNKSLQLALPRAHHQARGDVIRGLRWLSPTCTSLSARCRERAQSRG